MSKNYFVSDGNRIGYMSTVDSSAEDKKIIANGAITKGKLLMVTGDLEVAHATVGSNALIGVAMFDTEDTKPVAVECRGLCKLTASGAITAGDRIVAGADGDVASYDVGSPSQIVGIALSSATIGADVFVNLSL